MRVAYCLSFRIVVLTCECGRHKILTMLKSPGQCTHLHHHRTIFLFRNGTKSVTNCWGSVSFWVDLILFASAIYSRPRRKTPGFSHGISGAPPAGGGNC